MSYAVTDVKELKKIVADHEKRLKKLESSQKQSTPLKQKTVNRPKSIPGLLVELKTEGFFKQPRVVKEIVDRLATKGYHYSGSSLTWALQNTVKTHVLGRIKQGKQWAYVNR